MAKPMEPVEETQIIRKNTGYFWSYSFESGPSGSRQKLILTGNVEGMERALTELRRAKVKLHELAEVSAETLAKPLQYEGFTKQGHDDAGRDLLYD